MRKLMATILCVLMVLLLFSCGTQSDIVPDSEPTADTFPVLDTTSGVFRFPEGCVIGGIDVSGMLGTDAYRELREAAENYVLKLNINNTSMILWADDFNLTYSSDLMHDYVSALKEGKDPRSITPFTYDKGLLRYQIASCLFELPKNVSLVYNKESDSFDFTESMPGTGYDLEPIMEALDPVILSLGAEYSSTATTTELSPTITAESDHAKNAQKAANQLLKTDLTYTFTPNNSRTSTEKVSVDDIGSFFTFDETLQPVVNETAVNKYVNELSKVYSVGTNDGKFLTSLGEYVDLEIYYAEQLVDTDALTADIIYCFENGISGTREAPYKPADQNGLPHDLGGNYVEVNLTEQCLWVYNNHECVMYTPVVTGCLANNWETPTGAYAVVYKDLGSTLMGMNVTWWAPFYRGYGLHDATWRSVFDDDEYLFNGSHGCVNIPPSKMRTVFNNIYWHTPVIVYGGANNGNPVTQVLSGTSEYNVGVDVGTFTLDTKPKYGSTGYLSYTSDNPEIATVSKKGVVTVLSTGTVNITVESKDWSFCPSAKKVITINVHEDCSDVGHMIVNWKQTVAPTCESTGVETGMCTSCDYTETRTVNESHSFRAWSVTADATCTQAGEMVRSCRRCSLKETNEIPAVGHTYVGWYITKNATDTTPGEMIGHCYYCGLEETKVIPVKD